MVSTSTGPVLAIVGYFSYQSAVLVPMLRREGRQIEHAELRVDVFSVGLGTTGESLKTQTNVF